MVNQADKLRLPLEALHRAHDAAAFPFECTDELSPLTEFVGQGRALRALQFGLNMDKAGYNIFVTGLTGTGKATAILDYIRREVEERRKTGELKRPDDWCYVYNFEDPDRPRAISMAPGGGRRLREHLDELLASVRGNLTRAFSSEEYEHQKRAVFEKGQQEAQPLMEEAQKKAQEAGFWLRFAPTGVNLVPMLEGRPMEPGEFAALSVEERRRIAEREQPIAELVNEAGEKLRGIEREVAEALRLLDRRIAEAIMKGSFDRIMAAYQDDGTVLRFLQQLHEYTLAGADLIREHDGSQREGVLPGLMPSVQIDPFAAFRCNVFVDNSATEGPPIIVEVNPGWTNLFGRIERRAYLGTYVSDHTMLKPGSVQRANGGYLILNLVDVMTKPGAWDGLKRLIRTKEVRLEDPMEQYGYLTPQTLRPEPIPVDAKLVITGDPMAYFLLSAYDEEFWEMFKVKADFDYQIPRTPENALAYAGFICACCQREGLRHFDRTGVARLIDHGSRMVDDQEKLSARFGRLRDVVVEADYWARAAGSDLVTAAHVEQAVSERTYRLNLVEERIREMITRGTIIVDTEGAVVGQVNGLSVLDLGDFSFGRPSRITARTFLGQRGVASIDRESQLSGKLHDKGVLILSGYLGWKYAQDKPLSLSASISFEQGYEAVDGDSASLAELCAILSSLADAPIRQDLALTGSVNQKGEVQPIGGLNQKAEGFHDVCQAFGFSGRHGIVIPARNRSNLMLRKDVLDSVARGDFHVYAVNSVDEAIELLTGTPAGERGPDGAYPEGSINARVDARLREMGEAMRHFGRRPRDGATPDKPEENGTNEEKTP
ncbi:MAG: AAA family ATPase [Dehalococcoidia bacterium]|nr:AAA family ATPase [Dehalococcoidia bacterium]